MTGVNPSDNVVALGRGDFFAVDRRTWAMAFDTAGLHAALADLVLARGSLADMRTTLWSAEAINDRSRLNWRQAKEARSGARSPDGSQSSLCRHYPCGCGPEFARPGPGSHDRSVKLGSSNLPDIYSRCSAEDSTRRHRFPRRRRSGWLGRVRTGQVWPRGDADIFARSPQQFRRLQLCELRSLLATQNIPKLDHTNPLEGFRPAHPTSPKGQTLNGRRERGPRSTRSRLAEGKPTLSCLKPAGRYRPKPPNRMSASPASRYLLSMLHKRAFLSTIFFYHLDPISSRQCVWPNSTASARLQFRAARIVSANSKDHCRQYGRRGR